MARGAGDNLFTRFVRVAKSNANKVLKSFEDPEKVLDQAVDEMQSDLIRVRQSYAEVLATQRRVVQQKQQQDEQAQQWHQRAELAVDKGDDVLAKEALVRRQAAVMKASDLGQQLSGMSESVEKLFDAVQVLEEKIIQAKDQKEQLIARARTAKTTSQVNGMLSDLGQSTGAGAFDRMKEKVEMLESHAEVSAGLLPGMRDSTTGQPLEERFRELESGFAVDDELARLKGGKALPAGKAQSSGKDVLDEQLEAMRERLKAASDE